MFLSENSHTQIPGIQAVYHGGDDIDDFIKSTSSRVHQAFNGETQQKVIKAVHRRTGSSKIFSFSASLDLIVLSGLEDWLKGKVETEYSPVIVDFQFFVG